MGANIDRNDVAIVDGNPFQSIQFNRNDLTSIEAPGASVFTEINRAAGIVIDSKYPYIPPPPANGAIIDRAAFVAVEVGDNFTRVDAARAVVIDSKYPFVPPPPRPGSNLDRIDLCTVIRPGHIAAKLSREDFVAVDTSQGVLTLDRENVTVIDANETPMFLDASRLVVIESRYYAPGHVPGGGVLRHFRVRR